MTKQEFQKELNNIFKCDSEFLKKFTRNPEDIEYTEIDFWVSSKNLVSVYAPIRKVTFESLQKISNLINSNDMVISHYETNSHKLVIYFIFVFDDSEWE